MSLTRPVPPWQIFVHEDRAIPAKWIVLLLLLLAGALLEVPM